MSSFLRLIPGIALLGMLQAATDFYELPPIRYSAGQPADPVTRLSRELEEQPALLQDKAPLERLQWVLKQLEIPEHSQILVFSKTSKQNSLIHPANPRAIFFNENAYVGYVPGGDIEVISHDPQLGPVFHMISNGSRQPKIARKTSECLSCHGTARTESVPGVLVRSVFPDAAGQPLLALGSHHTTHVSPIPERWGGYYVTGRSSLPHLGNRTFTEADEPLARTNPPHYRTLESVIDTKRYPRPTSDIVSLMVLEHQCQVHNLLTAQAMNYRRFLWLRQSLDPAASPRDAVVRQYLQQAAARILPELLFAGEAALGGDGIEGDPAFQAAFTKRFPKSRDGRSLADFQLYKRLFKYRCSYMIYSQAFRDLPAELRSTILIQLQQVLQNEPGSDDFPHLQASERRKIRSILAETLPDWPIR